MMTHWLVAPQMTLMTMASSRRNQKQQRGVGVAAEVGGAEEEEQEEAVQRVELVVVVGVAPEVVEGQEVIRMEERAHRAL